MKWQLWVLADLICTHFLQLYVAYTGINYKNYGCLFLQDIMTIYTNSKNTQL